MRYIFISFIFCSFCTVSKCEVRYFTKYFKFEYAGETQLYCADYFIDLTKFGPIAKMVDFEKLEGAIDLPDKISIWFSKFIELEIHMKYSRYKFNELDTIDLKQDETVRILDYNVDGIDDIGFLNREASGKNVIYDVYLNLEEKWVRWYGAPNPIWGVDVESRTITGGWSLNASEITSGTHRVTGDTNLQLINLWKTIWDDKRRKLIRKDSIFQNDSWIVKIDSNFTF